MFTIFEIFFSGYNNRKISDIDTRWRHEHNNCLKQLLHDWERQNMATIGKLFQTLRNIGREDAARVLFIDSMEGRTHLAQNQKQTNQERDVV